MSTEPCQCVMAGYCERHRRVKGQHLFSLCQTREDYRRAFDEMAAQAPPIRKLTCVHRGEQVRTEKCKTCKGEVKLKVFACPHFGECTVEKKLPDVACCAKCDQHQTE